VSVDLTSEVYCSGCGVRLQSTYSSELGYLPMNAFQRQPIICQRCYRIKHYNDAAIVTPHSNDFLALLHAISQTDSLVVHIVDLFDFDGTLISGLPRFVGSRPVILAMNKVDLLPREVNTNRLLNWVQRRLKEAGLKVEEIFMFSAKSGVGFEPLIEFMSKWGKGKNIYLVGATNVGKSSIMNRILRDYSDLDREITVSTYPGTTLDLIKVPLNNRTTLIDMPGVVYPYRLTELIHRTELSKLVPHQMLKPITFQLNHRQTLFFGALARFDFVQGAKQSFTCYVCASLKIHRTKLEHADELYQKQRGSLLQPPAAQYLDDLPPFVKHRFRIQAGMEQDLFISGLGWICIQSKLGATVEVQAPKGVKVILRECLI
jgi:ribosome biogenesis GTPase YqeH